MEIDPKYLKVCNGGLAGFIGPETQATRKITLPLSIEEWPKASTEIVDTLFFL